MIIWFALGIPVVTALILLVGFRQATKWWEFLIPFAVSFVLILLFKFGVSTILTADTEYWGGWIVEARYYEAWDEEVCWSVYDEDGNYEGEECTTNYYPEYWEVHTSNGEVVNITEEFYERLVKLFENKRFVDMHRSYDSEDGDMYKTLWNRVEKTLFPVTTCHYYENKVQASTSVFNFPEVDTSTIRSYGLYEYPEITNPFNVPSILSRTSISNFRLAERKFDLMNARMGCSKQIRFWVLIFEDQPLEAGHAQEWLWKGGNKNEFVLTIGVDKDKRVQWVYTISWTEVQQLKVEAEFFVNDMDTLDLVKVADWLMPKANELWERKLFVNFDYITIEPPLWSVITTFVVTLIVNILLSLWITLNGYRD